MSSRVATSLQQSSYLNLLKAEIINMSHHVPLDISTQGWLNLYNLWDTCQVQ